MIVKFRLLVDKEWREAEVTINEHEYAQAFEVVAGDSGPIVRLPLQMHSGITSLHTICRRWGDGIDEMEW